MSSPRTTVVAYDGSDAARGALHCAARRIGQGGKLVVAHAARVPAQFLDTVYYEESLKHARERAEEVLIGIEAEVPEGIELETCVLSGPPARSLVRVAQEHDAAEIATGSRGFGGVRGTALGSTSHALLHESDRPVLVVTDRAIERESQRPAEGAGDSLTIVVGYDGSVNANAALGYAAKRLEGVENARLVAVYSYVPPPDWKGAPYYQQALNEHRGRGRDLLQELQDKGVYPGLLTTELLEGPPAEALVRAAHTHDADEIVVGSRGLGRFRAAIGSVSHALLHETDVPVVIIPGAE